MWKITKLGDICKIQSGNSIPVKEKESLYRNVNEGLPYVATKDVGFDGVIDYENGIRIPPNHSSKFRLSKKDSILVCAEGGSAGRKIAFSNKDCHFVNKLFSISPGSKMTSKYVYYYTLSKEFQSQFKKSMHGLIGGVSLSKIKNFQITHPPLSEQQRIIAKLDAAFAEIDKIFHLESLNNKNKENILDNYLSKIFLNNSSSSTKKEYELGEICKIVGGGTPSKSIPEFYEGKIPWATVRDMKKDIIENTQFKINKEAIIKSSTNIIPKKNVVIATRVGLGKVCILKNDTAINQDLKGIIPINPKTIDVNFLFYWFKSISKIITNFGTGLTVKGVKLPFIKSLKINLPSINEQRKIVEKIYTLQTNLDTMKVIKEKKINNLNYLRSSLLKSLLNKNKAA